MAAFPRTTVGGVSLSRMIIGTNWFFGFSHCTAAKDQFIRDFAMNRKSIADIIEVFLRAGVDTLMGQNRPVLAEAMREAEDRVGRKLIMVSTPGFPITPQTPANGLDADAVRKVLDEDVSYGSTFCLPHQSCTDALVDRCTRKIRHMDWLCARIRERGMVPGLSTHMPESIIYADESGLDVETYISIYNSMGFLMQVEVDWVGRIIRKAKKPVMTIKPMAAGQVRPYQAFHFVWSSLRERDMVTVGTITPREAQECIDLSLGVLSGRESGVALQETRSKAAVKAIA